MNWLLKVLACMTGNIVVVCSCPALLAYAFLLDLMQPPWEGTRDWIMHFWCHRTGAWTRQTLVPFTRLRTALSQLWIAFPPSILLPGRSSPGAAFRRLQDSG